MSKKVILITGSSSGFGHEAALQYARNGYQVVASMRNTEKASNLLINEPNIELQQLDLTDSDSIKNAVSSIVKKYGTIDVLFNNAGYGEIGAVEEAALEDMKKQFQTNFFGPIELIQSVLPVMRKNNGGHILNVSSMGAYIVIPTMGVYTSSKAAFTNMTNVLAEEVKEFNIQVTLVEPGGFMTKFFDNMHFAEKTGDYSNIYKRAEEYTRNAIEEVGLGNLEKSVNLLVNTTLKANAPKHLALGMQGYNDALGSLEYLISQFKENVEMTKTTD